MKTILDFSELAARVAAITPQSARIVTGFDGFVDEMITLVGERRSPDDFTAVPDIATFGKMITAAAGHSSLREIVVNAADPRRHRLGGRHGVHCLGRHLCPRQLDWNHELQPDPGAGWHRQL